MAENIVQIVPASDRHMRGIGALRRQFLGSKHCVCCISLGWSEGEQSARSEYRKHPEKQPLCAVAVSKRGSCKEGEEEEEEEEEVLGFLQLCLHGTFSQLHRVSPGEAYVEMIAVGHGHRGKRIGTRLMEWAETMAREHSCNYLSLEVVRNNPAVALYERLGYVSQPVSTCQATCNLFYVCCLMGPAVCPVGAENYLSWGRSEFMVKKLIEL